MSSGSAGRMRGVLTRGRFRCQAVLASIVDHRWLVVLRVPLIAGVLDLMAALVPHGAHQSSRDDPQVREGKVRMRIVRRAGGLFRQRRARIRSRMIRRMAGAVLAPPSSHDVRGVGVENRRFTIAIDGPAAAGKSTVGEIVARRLSAVFFDTGILYRALTALALERGVSSSDATALAGIASDMNVSVTRATEQHPHHSIVTVNGDDMTLRLRSAAVDRAVSEVSSHAEVRLALIDVQRKIGRSGAVVMVGRDIGTIVMPDAELKVFLLASPEERARRRYVERSTAGAETTLDDVYEDVLKRDKSDSERDISPLRPAGDAVIINSDTLTIGEVADIVVSEAVRRLPVDSPR
jgi:CMP/dCMP kinase